MFFTILTHETPQLKHGLDVPEVVAAILHLVVNECEDLLGLGGEDCVQEGLYSEVGDEEVDCLEEGTADAGGAEGGVLDLGGLDGLAGGGGGDDDDADGALVDDLQVVALPHRHYPLLLQLCPLLIQPHLQILPLTQPHHLLPHLSNSHLRPLLKQLLHLFQLILINHSKQLIVLLAHCGILQLLILLYELALILISEKVQEGQQ